MSLRKRIEDDLLKAVKDKNELARDVLRSLKSSLKNQEIELKKTSLEDSGIEKIIAKEAKKRRESIDAFSQANKHELAETEKAELELLLKYLPEQLSDEKVEKIVSETIYSLGQDANTGSVMREVSSKLKGKTDMGKVSQIVNKKLAK